MCPETLIAYVYGDTPPDFEAIAAFGFDIVCLDSRARWFSEQTVGDAKKHGLMAFAFQMSYAG